MNYLPYENLNLTTSLNPEEVKLRIRSRLERPKTFRFTGLSFGGGPEKYEGTLIGNEFNVSRIIKYRNSFLPRIKGIIQSSESGSEVSIKMKLNTFVIIFSIFWLTGVFIGCIAMVVAISQSSSFELVMLVPFGMLIFFYLLVTLGFKYESSKSKKFFKELLEAKEKKVSVLIEKY